MLVRETDQPFEIINVGRFHRVRVAQQEITSSRFAFAIGKAPG
jgi:hypothetical protein